MNSVGDIGGSELDSFVGSTLFLKLFISKNWQEMNIVQS